MVTASSALTADLPSAKSNANPRQAATENWYHDEDTKCFKLSGSLFEFPDPPDLIVLEPTSSLGL
jgi:hypothetical protein